MPILADSLLSSPAKDVNLEDIAQAILEEGDDDHFEICSLSGSNGGHESSGSSDDACYDAWLASAEAMMMAHEHESALSDVNLFVTHLPLSIDDSRLRQLFSVFGDVESSVVMRDIFTGASRGVGFVLFKSAPAAKLAIERMHRSNVNGKTITVQFAKQFNKGTMTTRVFIRNLPKGITEEQVRELCTPFGEVTWVSVHADSVKTTKQLRNIAFVNFSQTSDAEKAARVLHNTRPFAGCENAALMTKVVAENLPTKKSRRHQPHSRRQTKQNARAPAGPVEVKALGGGINIPQPISPQQHPKVILPSAPSSTLLRQSWPVDVNSFSANPCVQPYPVPMAAPRTGFPNAMGHFPVVYPHGMTPFHIPTILPSGQPGIIPATIGYAPMIVMPSAQK